MKRITFSAALFAAASAGAALAGGQDLAVPFPTGYEETFLNYFRGDRQNGKQVISIYANDIAVKGARGDGRLPPGSIIVGEITPALTDAKGEPLTSRLGHLIDSGEVSAIVVMTRIAGNDARYPDELKVGDWEFEVFSPTGENLGKDTTACRECHHPLTDTEFMWSYEHLAQRVVE